MENVNDEMMMLENLLDFLHKEVPEHAKELDDAVEALSEVLERTHAVLAKKVITLMEAGDSKSDEYYNRAKELRRIKQVVDQSYEKSLSIERTEAYDEPITVEKVVGVPSIRAKQSKPKSTKGTRVNYNNYRVDETKEYSIYVDFLNTRPSGFKLEGTRYDVREWYSMTVKVCEILYERDKKMFHEIVRGYSIKGRKKAYIAFEGDSIAKTILKPKKVLNTDIIVEQVLNANQHRDIIAKLLEKFKISKANFKIYLRTDTKELHQNNSVQPIEEQKKIIQARNPDDYRFAKETVNHNPEPERKSLNERIGTPSHVSYLKMSEGDTRRHKARCKEYDKKKVTIQNPL